jgi:glycosyltransferase involved in cell wall biosynthesis
VQELARLDGENTYALYTPAHVPEFEGLPERFQEVIPAEGFDSLSSFNESFTTTSAFSNERYDLVHPFLFAIPDGYESLPMLYTVHDIIPALVTPLTVLKRTFPFSMLSKDGSRKRKIGPAALNNAKGIIAISNATKRDIVNVMKVPAEKITVVENGVDHALFAYEADEKILSRLRLHRNRYFVYFGGHSKRKNLLRAVRAHALLPEETRHHYPFVIIGSGYCEDIVRRHFERDPYVLMTGRLEENDLYALVKNAYVSVYPSLYEGFGLTLLEAGAFGVPTIASDNSAIREVMPAATYFVNPYDVRDIARTMERVIDHHGERHEMGISAEAASRKYSWQTTAKGILAVYRHVLNQ